MLKIFRLLVGLFCHAVVFQQTVCGQPQDSITLPKTRFYTSINLLNVLMPIGEFSKTSGMGVGTLLGNAEYQLTNRFAISINVAATRHPFKSETLYPNIDIDGESGVIYGLLGAKIFLTNDLLRLYLCAGSGFMNLITPTVSVEQQGNTVSIQSGTNSAVFFLIEIGGGIEVWFSETTIAFLEVGYGITPNSTRISNGPLSFFTAYIGTKVPVF
jgi:hypothetical protein